MPGYCFPIRKAQKWVVVCCALVLIAVPMFVPAQVSRAQGSLVVRVTIEMVQWGECEDNGSPPDIYFWVTINGHSQRSEGEITSNISPFYPTSLVFSESIDSSSTRHIPIVIEMWDADGGFAGDDDHCDIYRGQLRNVIMSLDLASCSMALSDEDIASCGTH